MNISSEIWIASYISELQGWTYLKYALESCSKFHPKASIYLVINCNGFDIEELKSITNLTIYEQTQRINQMDGYEIIYHQRKLTGSPEDIILFLDDDDIILPCAFNYMLENPEHQGQVGLQILPLFNNHHINGCSDVNVDTISDFLAKYEAQCQIVDDFSGTTLRRKYLDGFFNRPKDLSTLLIRNVGIGDTELMNYVEGLGGISKLPTIYRRIKPYQSSWRIDYYKIAEALGSLYITK